MEAVSTFPVCRRPASAPDTLLPWPLDEGGSLSDDREILNEVSALITSGHEVHGLEGEHELVPHRRQALSEVGRGRGSLAEARQVVS